MKQIGFITVGIGLILGLIQGYLLISAYLTDNWDIDNLIILIRPFLISAMLIGFALIVTGGVIQSIRSKGNEEADSSTPKDKINKTPYIVSAIIGCATIIPLLILVVMYSSFYIPYEVRVAVFFLSIITIVWLAVSLPLYVDKINKDTLEIHLFGLHFHETFIGILMIVTGFIFIMHHVIPFDFIFGAYYLIIGAFLMGRDIEDLRQFKIIEKI